MCTDQERSRGFTLLEVLVAFAIAAIALAVLVRAAGFGVSAVHQSDRYEEAVSRARSHLAALAAGIEKLPPQRTGDDGNGFRWRLDIRPYQVPRRATTGPPPPATPRLYAVAVTISWTEGATRRSVTLNSDRLGLLGP